MLEKPNYEQHGIYHIRKFGDPVLLQKTKQVDDINNNLLMAVKSMNKFLNPGAVGVAANQVGIQRSFFVWAIDGPPKVIINPMIIDWNDDTFDAIEGCLSMPGVKFRVRRWQSVTLLGLDINGENLMIHSKTELESCLFQHEVDHLNGVLALTNPNLLEYGAA